MNILSNKDNKYHATIMSRRMRWAVHVARMGQEEFIQRYGGEARRRLYYDNVKLDLKRLNGVVWYGFIWLRIGTSGGLLSTG
jgi:hypothetical protein